MLDFLKTFVFLFAVIDPLGSIPVFLEATKDFDNSTKKKVAIKASFIAAGILLFFIGVGQLIMEAMHISLPAFQVSGGLILFLFALTMVFGNGHHDQEKKMIKDHKSVTIFPIAIPSIASPGAIMAVVLLTDNNTYTFTHQLLTTAMVMVVLAVICLLLLAARKIQDVLNESGIMIITKVMGLILAAFAVESILSGIKDYFKIA